MTASHWRQKQTNFLLQIFYSFNSSHLLSAPTCNSWVTHVLFVAMPLLRIGSALLVHTIIIIIVYTI